MNSFTLQIVREALSEGAKAERELRLDFDRQQREKEAMRASAALKQVEAAEALYPDRELRFVARRWCWGAGEIQTVSFMI